MPAGNLINDLIAISFKKMIVRMIAMGLEVVGKKGHTQKNCFSMWILFVMGDIMIGELVKY